MRSAIEVHSIGCIYLLVKLAWLSFYALSSTHRIYGISVLTYRALQLRVRLNSLFDMINVMLRRITTADRTAFDFWEIVCDYPTKLVFLSSSCHEPVAVDAEDVEPVEAVVNSH